MATITDSFSMSIGITPHGTAKIVLPITYPATVEPNTPFDITYTVRNEGTATETLFGQLAVGGTVLTGSYWASSVAVNGTITKTYTHSGISATTTIVLSVGRL